MNLQTPAFIALIAFVALAVFGFAAMLGEMNETHDNCLASLANNGCPMPASGPAMALFHVSAYQAFSAGILTFAFFSLIILAAFSLRLAFGWLEKSQWKLVEKLSREFFAFESVIFAVRHWLCRLEKRDPALAN